MCGIAFLYQPAGARPDREQRLRRALAAQQHRGPDAEGIWSGEGVSIGHRRLSIIDLSASSQPMLDPSGRYVLSFNGEIYNYKELRASLEGRWRFRTSGDTEVLLAGLLIRSTAFLQEMEGMWAFALWDEKERDLLLCRDRMGKKPLYYQQENGSFLCASELPALSCLREEPWREDLDSTADYLRHGYYLPGATAYMGVHEVLPGHFMQWTSGQEAPRQRQYWSLSVQCFSGNRTEAASALEEALVQAVAKRMVADVEVGAFLSGGVDSSLIVSIMGKRLGIHPKTFTIGFQEHSFDERQFAGLVAEDCGTDHHEEILAGWDHQQLVQLILHHVGQPFADSSLLPTTLVSGLAARKVKVALSGDGGDELFCGYQRYQARNILRWYTRLPKSLRATAGRLIRALPEPMAHHSHSILKKAHLFQDIVDRLGWETPYVAPVLYTRDMYASLFPDLLERGHRPPQLPDECCEDYIQRMMLADALVYLPQDILLKVDRASMACSLETRAPFLDSKVVELAFSLPRSWHRSGLAGKKMLRQTFAGLLPDTIWRRRKQGFGVPIHEWFRQDLGKELAELLIRQEGPCNRQAILHLLDQHRKGNRDHGYRLWSVYIYMLWLIDEDF